MIAISVDAHGGYGYRYGLTDIQEYFANTGALKKAAENVQGAGSRVNVSIIEAFDKTIRPRELESVLRMEYRYLIHSKHTIIALIALDDPEPNY